MCFYFYDIFNVKSLKYVYCVLKSGFGDRYVYLFIGIGKIFLVKVIVIEC